MLARLAALPSTAWVSSLRFALRPSALVGWSWRTVASATAVRTAVRVAAWVVKLHEVVASGRPAPSRIAVAPPVRVAVYWVPGTVVVGASTVTWNPTADVCTCGAGPVSPS